MALCKAGKGLKPRPSLNKLFKRSTSEEKAEFFRAKVGNFCQASPQHENAFTSDKFLQKCLSRLTPPDFYRTEIEPDLNRFGARVVDEIWDLGRECELNPPTMSAGGTDPWGHPARNPLQTCDAWKKQKVISAEEGLIALAYPDYRCQFKRIHQVAKLYLYGPSSGLYSCPLAMTDGAATVLKSLQSSHPALKNAYERLTSRDPDRFWTSGQWMTEKRGGSDVGGGTQTLAFPSDSGYKLSGYKWFSSATDSDMALTLARIDDGKTDVVSGTRGISMFFLETRGGDGKLNNISVMKLKNKLGTRQLPTAELLLDGSDAILVSDQGKGIASISPMLTVTRMHNIIMSVSGQRKILSLARDYAHRRTAFGKLLKDQPLHLNSLLNLETDVRGCTILMMELARLMGLEESGNAGEQDSMILRLMMPVAKAFTAKKAVANISEGLECFGGQGYIEDTGLPSMLRDAQVLPIWEGTTNVMALDVVRAIMKTEGEALNHFKARIGSILEQAANINDLSQAVEDVQVAMKKLDRFLLRLKSVEDNQVALRDFLYSLANVYIAGLLIEHAAHYPDSKSDAIFACQWTTRRDLIPVASFEKGYVTDNRLLEELVYEGYEPNQTRSTVF